MSAHIRALQQLLARRKSVLDSIRILWERRRDRVGTAFSCCNCRIINVQTYFALKSERGRCEDVALSSCNWQIIYVKTYFALKSERGRCEDAAFSCCNCQIIYVQTYFALKLECADTYPDLCTNTMSLLLEHAVFISIIHSICIKLI